MKNTTWIRLDGREMMATLSTNRCTPSRNASLTIQIRLNLVRSNPKNGAATGHLINVIEDKIFKTIRWEPGEWKMWCTRFLTESENFWNYKLWLVTPPFSSLKTDFDFPKPLPTHRANIGCFLDLKLASPDPRGIKNYYKSPHHTIEVVRLHPSEHQSFRSNMLLYTDRDLEETKPRGHTYVIAFHEVGHLLGLDHPNPKCIGNPLACYGVNPAQTQQVMGAGMRIKSADAKPWMKAMADFYSQTSYTDWDPFPRRIPPRPLSEVKMNFR